MTYAELFAFASEHGLELNPDLEAKFHRYAELLAAWNEKMNLTSITEESEVIEKHFLDSLTPAFTTSFAGKSVADMGSGAGFPGMVFATAFPSCHVTLMDATKKKFLFLEELKKDVEQIAISPDSVMVVKHKDGKFTVVEDGKPVMERVSADEVKKSDKLGKK